MNAKAKVKSTLAEKPKRTVRKKEKHYSHEYLALALCAMLLLQVFAFEYTKPSDWKAGLSLLDMTEEVRMTGENLADIMSPMVLAIEGVNDFYLEASDQITVLFDLSDSDPFLAVKGINEFYRLASVEMEHVLDLTSYPVFDGMVAGAYTER